MSTLVGESKFLTQPRFPDDLITEDERQQALKVATDIGFCSRFGCSLVSMYKAEGRGKDPKGSHRQK